MPGQSSLASRLQAVTVATPRALESREPARHVEVQRSLTITSPLARPSMPFEMTVRFFAASIFNRH